MSAVNATEFEKGGSNLVGKGYGKLVPASAGETEG